MQEVPQPWRYQDRADVEFLTEDRFPWRMRLLRWAGRQVWMPRGQHALLNAIHDRDCGGHFHFEIDFFGQRYRGDLANYVDWYTFCYGAAPYSELTLLRDLAAFLRKSDGRRIAFCDIGANVGHHSLYMAKHADDVFAFEPYQDLIPHIRDKLTINDLTNVRVFPFALGDEDSHAAYFPGIGANPGAGSLLPSYPDTCEADVRVDVRAGDHLFEELALPRIDLMKIDVQGFEPQVLRGLAGRIRKDRPAIIMEVTDESRQGFGGEAALRNMVYGGAIFWEVGGRDGRPYRLEPYSYATSFEILICPPEMNAFVEARV